MKDITVKELLEIQKEMDSKINRFIDYTINTNTSRESAYLSEIRGYCNHKIHIDNDYRITNLDLNCFRYGEGGKIESYIKFYYREFLKLLYEFINKNLKKYFNKIPEYKLTFSKDHQEWNYKTNFKFSFNNLIPDFM